MHACAAGKRRELVAKTAAQFHAVEEVPIMSSSAEAHLSDLIEDVTDAPLTSPLAVPIEDHSCLPTASPVKVEAEESGKIRETSTEPATMETAQLEVGGGKMEVAQSEVGRATEGSIGTDVTESGSVTLKMDVVKDTVPQSDTGRAAEESIGTDITESGSVTPRMEVVDENKVPQGDTGGEMKGVDANGEVPQEDSEEGLPSDGDVSTRLGIQGDSKDAVPIGLKEGEGLDAMEEVKRSSPFNEVEGAEKFSSAIDAVSEQHSMDTPESGGGPSSHDDIAVIAMDLGGEPSREATPTMGLSVTDAMVEEEKRLKEGGSRESSEDCEQAGEVRYNYKLLQI